jgi:hypothetical protein
MQTYWGGLYEKLNTFFNKIGLTWFPVQKENTGMLSKWDYLFWHKLECHSSTRMKHFLRPPSWSITHLARSIIFLPPCNSSFISSQNYLYLRIFGCSCWPYLRPFNSWKLEFWSKECAFLGYSNIHKGSKCLDFSIGRIYISHDVIFDQTVFPFTKLQPNAGPRLREEILLSPSLINHSHGGEIVTNQGWSVLIRIHTRCQHWSIDA